MAPKPSPTFIRKKSDAPEVRNAGVVNVAVRPPLLGVSVTLATGHDGAHGVVAVELAVWIHW